MKKILFLISIFTMALFFSQQTYGQASQSVGTNSTFTYQTTASVAGGSTFAWSITTGTNGTEYQYTATTTNQISIQWKVAGTYRLYVKETSVNTCSDPTLGKYIDVTVAGNEISFVAPYTAGPLCSDLNADETLTVQFKYALSSTDYPVTVTANVSINGAAPTSQTYTVASDNILTIAHGTTAFQGNTTTSDVTNTIVLQSAKLASTDVVNASATNVTFSRQVYGTPATTGITFLP